MRGPGTLTLTNVQIQQQTKFIDIVSRRNVREKGTNAANQRPFLEHREMGKCERRRCIWNKPT